MYNSKLAPDTRAQLTSPAAIHSTLATHNMHLRLLSPVTLLRVPAACTCSSFLHLFHAAVAQSSTLSISHKLPLFSHRTFRYLPGCHAQLASRGLSEALILTTADCAVLLRSAATDYRCHRSRICLQEGLARCAKWHRIQYFMQRSDACSWQMQCRLGCDGLAESMCGG